MEEGRREVQRERLDWREVRETEGGTRIDRDGKRKERGRERKKGEKDDEKKKRVSAHLPELVCFLTRQ